MKAKNMAQANCSVNVIAARRDDSDDSSGGSFGILLLLTELFMRRNFIFNRSFLSC
ncbi:MAG: hypothetical protein L3J89_14775 [Gammaproteobacteria bacterium]|nr:hypothetical protein [Gammaproteobacteria bacterium]